MSSRNARQESQTPENQSQTPVLTADSDSTETNLHPAVSNGLESAKPAEKVSPQTAERFHAWLKSSLSSATFNEELSFLDDDNLSGEERLLVLDKLHSWRRYLEPDQIKLLLSATISIAEDISQPPKLRSRAVNAVATVLVVMQEKDLIKQDDVDGYLSFFRQLMEDQGTDSFVRGSAIRALGILKANDVGSAIASNLEDAEFLAKPELTRNACLALAQIEGESAVGPIGSVLATTTNEAIFGTAAFTLGQMPTEASLELLVDNENRFPGSGSIDAVLVDMEDVILGVLSEPTNPRVSSAITATRHLWKDGQRERYVPLLRELITTASLSLQREAVQRLMEEAASLSLEREQEELEVIFPTVAGSAGLEDYAQQIQIRLDAKLIVPDAEPISTISNPRTKEINEQVKRHK